MAIYQDPRAAALKQSSLKDAAASITDDLLYQYIEREVANGATLLTPEKMQAMTPEALASLPRDGKYLLINENTLGALRAQLAPQLVRTTAGAEAKPGRENRTSGGNTVAPASLDTLKPLTYPYISANEADAQSRFGTKPKNFKDHTTNEKKSAFQSQIAVTGSALQWLNSPDVELFYRAEARKDKAQGTKFAIGMTVLTLGAAWAGGAFGAAAGAGTGTTGATSGAAAAGAGQASASTGLFSGLQSALQASADWLTAQGTVGGIASIPVQLAADAIELAGIGGFGGLVGEAAKMAAKAAIGDAMSGKATQKTADNLAELLQKQSAAAAPGTYSGGPTLGAQAGVSYGQALTPDILAQVQSRVSQLLPGGPPAQAGGKSVSGGVTTGDRRLNAPYAGKVDTEFSAAGSQSFVWEAGADGALAKRNITNDEAKTLLADPAYAARARAATQNGVLGPAPDGGGVFGGTYTPGALGSLEGPASEAYGLMSQLREPGAARARMSAEERQFAQGILGSSGGALQTRELLDSQNQARLQDRLAAIGVGENAEQRRIAEQGQLLGTLGNAESAAQSERTRIDLAQARSDLLAYQAAQQRGISDIAAEERKDNLYGGAIDKVIDYGVDKLFDWAF